MEVYGARVGFRFDGIQKDYYLKRYFYNDTQISYAGKARDDTLSEPITQKKFISDTYELITYQESDSIWSAGIFREKYDAKGFYFSFKRIDVIS